MTKEQIAKMNADLIQEARNPQLKEIKQFFRNVRNEQEEIQQIKALIAEKEMTLLPKAITYNGDKVQVSPDDKFSEVCAAISDLEMELGKSILILAKNQLKAEQMIKQLDDPNERKVMRYYYLTVIEGHVPTWNQVAIRMNYYESYVKKVHGNALVNLTKIAGGF